MKKLHSDEEKGLLMQYHSINSGKRMEGPRVAEVPNSHVERASFAPRCRNTSRLNKYLQPRQASLTGVAH